MSEADPQGVPQVQDKRPRASGLLPKNAQSLVLGAIALAMVLIIVFSGRTAPKTKTVSSAVVNDSVLEPSPARIQDYRARIEEQTRKLAAEEAQLAQTKAALGVHP